jgi:hypothetical protein
MRMPTITPVTKRVMGARGGAVATCSPRIGVQRGACSSSTGCSCDAL